MSPLVPIRLFQLKDSTRKLHVRNSNPFIFSDENDCEKLEICYSVAHIALSALICSWSKTGEGGAKVLTQDTRIGWQGRRDKSLGFCLALKPLQIISPATSALPRLVFKNLNTK